MKLFDEFLTVYDVWEQARPYVHLMVDEQEMQLVVAIQGRSATVDEIAELLGLPGAEAADLLERAYSCHIVNKAADAGVATFSVGTFWDRLDHFAKFENWDDIPQADRAIIDRRFFDEFLNRHRPSVGRMMQGVEPGGFVPNDAVLLVHEVEQMLDAATHIVVQPCDCRRLAQNCDRPVETCIGLDDSALEALDRGHGRRLTLAEAKALVHWADKKGLMHTGDSEWQTNGLHAICNCCACDCYPFRAGRELGSKGFWPKNRHIAVYDQSQCNLCGTCVRRCHFEAFYHDGSKREIDGKAKSQVQFAAELCWGCGLCANSCPSGAIVMEPLA